MGDPKLSLNICLGSASVESALKKLVEDGTLKRIGTGRKTNYVNADAYEDICFIYYLSQYYWMEAWYNQAWRGKLLSVWKCGYVKTGDETVVNENMTLVDYVQSCI